MDCGIYHTACSTARETECFSDCSDCIRYIELCVCVCVGAQLHHLTQVGLSSRMNGYPAGVRAAPGHNGGIGWNHYHDDSFSRTEPEKDVVSKTTVNYYYPHPQKKKNMFLYHP